MGNPHSLAQAGTYLSGAHESTTPSRVALADDHPEVLEEIQCLLEPEFQVVCSAKEGAILVQAVLESKPDGVVADVQMPGQDGIDAGEEILRRGLCNSIIMLSMYNDPQLIQKALDVGIRGYVLKEDAGEELIPALRAVLAGERYLSRGVRVAGRI